MQRFRCFAWFFSASSAFAQSPEWVTVRSSECGYMAKFPEQPTFRSDAVPLYAGGFRYSEYTVEDDHLVLNVTCSDVAKSMTEAKLDLAKEESDPAVTPLPWSRTIGVIASNSDQEL